VDLLSTLVAAEARTVLQGPAATRQAVLDALPSHAWVHFSCHGQQYMAAPAMGGLVLSDQVLTIADVAGHRRTAGELAFLSACKSATGGVGVADEAMDLATALQYLGYRHVVATLWSVSEGAAANVVADVYHRLVRAGQLDTRNTAEALHHAVRALRAESPYRPSRWTSFRHVGP
jgi:CHAT domain-containing protein